MSKLTMSHILFINLALMLFTFKMSLSQSLDQTFEHGLNPNGIIHTTAIQQDGKILIGGEFTEINGTQQNYLARLNDDGTVDNSFDIGTGANGKVYAIAIQNDGKIIVGGEFTNFNEVEKKSLSRLNIDGSMDTTFNIGNGANILWQAASVMTIAIQDDGKIIIGGNFLSFASVAKNRIARLNTDGSIDTDFDLGATNILGQTNNRVRTVAIQSDGKIVVGGEFSHGNIIRLNTDGSVDNTFETGTGTNNSIRTISIQNDDKIIIGGWFTSFNGTPENRIARLNSDGSLDTTFETGDPITLQYYQVRTTAIQDDGKIFMAGTIFTYFETVINNFARLNTDGSLDASFDLEAGVVGSINTVAIQDDGRIIIGGGFGSYYGSSVVNIARIDTIPSSVGTQSWAKNIENVRVSPNPFSNSTNLSFSLQKNQQVSLRVLDLHGREVAVLVNGQLSPGNHEFVFNGTNENSGVYIYQLNLDEKVETGKIILNK